MDISDLDNFFIIQGISLSVSAIFTVSFETTFQNFIPKWSLEKSKILLFKAILLTSFFYINFSIFYPKIILLFPYAIVPLFLSYLYSRKQYLTSNIINSIAIISLIITLITFKPKALYDVLKFYFFIYSIFAIILIIITKPKAHFNLKIVQDISNYYKIAFLSSLTSPLYRYLDRFILGLLGSNGDVTGFSLIRRIDNTFRQILNSPLSIVTIEISSNIHYFEKFFPKYLFIVFLLFLLELIGGYFIILIVSNSYFLKFYPSLVIFSITFLISAVFSIFIIRKRVQNEPKPFLIYNASFAILFFAFSIMLFPIFQSTAIAIGFLLSTIISGFLALVLIKL
ncbi:MAG: hypothetical protein ABIL37_02825 [candidate division WOR-3 bacterium]